MEKRFFLATFALAACLRAAPLRAACVSVPDPRPDIHVIVGFGSVGPWDTVVDVANTNASDVHVSYSTFFPFGPIKAPIRVFTVPANGTFTLTASAVLAGSLGNLWLVNAGGLAISARAVSSAQPDVSLTLPVTSFAALLAAFPGTDPEVLAFPLTGFSPASSASLLLGELGGCADATVSVLASDSKGDPLGSFDATVPAGGFLRLDGLTAVLGISDARGVQIRVVSSGAGLFWGEVVSYFGTGMRVVAGGLPR